MHFALLFVSSFAQAIIISGLPDIDCFFASYSRAVKSDDVTRPGPSKADNEENRERLAEHPEVVTRGKKGCQYMDGHLPGAGVGFSSTFN